MKKLMNRLREPSTWATVTAMLAAFGVQVDPGLMQNITMALTGLAGIFGMLMKEKGSQPGD